MIAIKIKLMKCRQILRDKTLDKDFRIAKVELELIKALDLLEKERQISDCYSSKIKR